jgi:hypothetical protein
MAEVPEPVERNHKTWVGLLRIARSADDHEGSSEKFMFSGQGAVRGGLR